MADRSFVDNLNKMVQDYFTNYKLSYDSATFPDSYNDKYSYIYSSILKTKGPDLIKLSNLSNHLSEWDRMGTFGGFIRSISIGPVSPMDPPSFANGSSPDNGIIRKADVHTTYHPFKVRAEFVLTQFANQLKEVMQNPEELAVFLAEVMTSLSDGANDTLYRIYKEVFYKYWTELPTAMQTQLSNDELPAVADLTTKDAAIEAVNVIRNYKTNYMFGRDEYNSQGFRHSVTPERQRLYITADLANILTDLLVLDHFMTEVTYSNVALNLSNFLGLPVRVLDDFGGRIPYDDANARLYPIYDADGAITGTYAATAGGTTSVPVDHWGPAANYNFRAILTEDDFGNVFPVNDSIRSADFIRGGGYTNTSRYVERILVAKPNCNTIFFQ